MKKLTTSGQSLFEVVLALGVVTVIIVSLVLLASNAIRNSRFSRNKTLATQYAQEATEWMRGERDLDFDDFSDHAVLSTTYCLQTLSWDKFSACSSSDTVADTVLIREVALTIDSPTQIQVDVVVFWTDSQGLHEVRSVTNFTDWRAQ